MVILQYLKETNTFKDPRSSQFSSCPILLIVLDLFNLCVLPTCMYACYMNAGLWNIPLHCVNICHCEWFNKEADWQSLGRIRSGGEPNRECWEEEGQSLRSSE